VDSTVAAAIVAATSTIVVAGLGLVGLLLSSRQAKRVAADAVRRARAEHVDDENAELQRVDTERWQALLGSYRDELERLRTEVWKLRAENDRLRGLIQ
jgi:threonine dehydrogenase-like Zn-dependent dehydrogenase